MGPAGDLQSPCLQNPAAALRHLWALAGRAREGMTAALWEAQEALLESSAELAWQPAARWPLAERQASP